MGGIDFVLVGLGLDSLSFGKFSVYGWSQLLKMFGGKMTDVFVGGELLKMFGGFLGWFGCGGKEKTNLLGWFGGFGSGVRLHFLYNLYLERI